MLPGMAWKSIFRWLRPPAPRNDPPTEGEADLLLAEQTGRGSTEPGLASPEAAEVAEAELGEYEQPSDPTP